MLLAEAVFMGLILYFSGVQGRANRICALKGSSVDLPCSAEYPTSTMKWFTQHWDGSTFVHKELSADESRVSYNMLEKSNFTLTIKDLTESDAKVYCCGETTEKTGNCYQSTIQLHVADLQVKVIPATEGQTVTLMCNTSCPLTGNPAVYIWYKNGEFLYQDWSPWYQQLVSSEEAVRYSCAVKSQRDLRAPEVSVDSVSPTCFTVTYAKGRMCSYNQTSEDEPCSITYPTEVRVQRTPVATSGHVRLTCNTSCPPTAFIWYKNLERLDDKTQFEVPSTSADRFSCAVKGFEDLHSDEVCVQDSTCWTVNYVRRRICAMEGSSVNISSEYSDPNYLQQNLKSWYKIKQSWKEEAEEQIKDDGRVGYYDNMKNQHTLTIKDLKKRDSGEYILMLQGDAGRKQSNFPGVTLVVTGLKVKFNPSAVVTEGQRVTLSCLFICPLIYNTSYIWYLNSRPLPGPENQNKHLVLDPVSSQHAGNYSCAVETHKRISSHKRTLTVQSITGKWKPAAAAGVCGALLVLITLAVFWWIRKKRTSSQSPRTETSGNLEQLNPGPVYDEISAQPTEQDEVLYSRVHFSAIRTDRLYYTVQPHQQQQQVQQQEHVPYAVVNFRQKPTPELH